MESHQWGLWKSGMDQQRSRAAPYDKAPWYLLNCFVNGQGRIEKRAGFKKLGSLGTVVPWYGFHAFKNKILVFYHGAENPNITSTDLIDDTLIEAVPINRPGRIGEPDDDVYLNRSVLVSVDHASNVQGVLYLIVTFQFTEDHTTRAGEFFTEHYFRNEEPIPERDSSTLASVGDLVLLRDWSDPDEPYQGLYAVCVDDGGTGKLAGHPDIGGSPPDIFSPPGELQGAENDEYADGDTLWLILNYYRYEYDPVTEYNEGRYALPDPAIPVDSKQALLLVSKLFAPDGEVCHFSKTGEPMDWNPPVDFDPPDAGFLPVGVQAPGESEANFVAVYKNDLAVFFDHSVQIWRVDPDPLLHFLRGILPGAGCRFRKTVISIDDRDLMFLSEPAFRLLNQEPETGEIIDDDVGAPIVDRLRAFFDPARFFVPPFAPGLIPIGQVQLGAQSVTRLTADVSGLGIFFVDAHYALSEPRLPAGEAGKFRFRMPTLQNASVAFFESQVSAASSGGIPRANRVWFHDDGTYQLSLLTSGGFPLYVWTSTYSAGDVFDFSHEDVGGTLTRRVYKNGVLDTTFPDAPALPGGMLPFIQPEDQGATIDQLECYSGAWIIEAEPIAFYYAAQRQYWCIIKTRAFVWTRSEVDRHAAWSEYLLPFAPSHVAMVEGRPHFRAGNEVWTLDESAVDDDGVPFEAQIETYFSDCGFPGIQKHVTGLDFSSTGTAEVTLLLNGDENKRLPAVTVSGDTRSSGVIPVEALGTSFALSIRHYAAQRWTFDMALLHYNPLGLV